MYYINIIPNNNHSCYIHDIRVFSVILSAHHTTSTMSSNYDPRTQQFWREFIDLFRNTEVLWNVNHPRYNCRFSRDKGFEIMLNKLKQILPKADIPMVKKKINMFRSNYRREIGRIKKSIEKGGKLYVPTVWYYKELEFLSGYYNIESNGDNNDSYQYEEESYSIDDDDNDSMLENKPITIDLEEGEVPYESHEESASQSHLQPQSTIPTTSTDIQPTFTHSTNSKKRKLDITIPDQESQDENSVIAKYWTNELNKLDPAQKLFAQKAINDILFEARMKTLHRHSVRINE